MPPAGWAMAANPWPCDGSAWVRTSCRIGRALALPRGMSRRQRVCESGFSLAETLIAVALLIGALLSLAQLFSAATAIVTTAHHLTAGSVLAAQKLEELRNVVSGSPSAIDTDGGIDYVDRVGMAASPGIDASTQVTYTRRWWIRPLAADPDHVSVIQVVVTPGAVREGTPAPIERRADEVVLVTMQARDEP